MYSNTLNSRQAAQEHVLAVSRDFISQPRLSETKKHFYYFWAILWVGDSSATIALVIAVF